MRDLFQIVLFTLRVIDLILRRELTWSAFEVVLHHTLEIFATLILNKGQPDPVCGNPAHGKGLELNDLFELF